MKAIIEKQRKAVRKARRESKRVPQICMVCDDLADRKQAMGHSLLRELMMRGRHSCISTILSTQKLRCIEHGCRLQATCLGMFKVRCKKDWEVVTDEFSNVVDPKTLEEMYKIATDEPYVFLFINMKDNRFFKSFKAELKPR